MKIFKLFVCIALILSISLINSFAAISVSDGSAFVTKAEFAADLNNLSNRMSSLENSLDAKIDSLVSSYLSRNGIWSGEPVNTSTSTYSYTDDETTIISKLPKSGLLLLPYAVDIQYAVGLYMKEQGTVRSETSVSRALGSPAYHSIQLTLNLYEKTTTGTTANTHTDIFNYALTGVYGTSGNASYRMQLNITPASTKMIFVTKDNSLSYKLNTKVNISVDYWSIKISIEGNNQTLTGDAFTVASSGETTGYNTSSKYTIKYKTDSRVSIY